MSRGPWACLGSFCRSAPGYAAQSAPAKISEIARSGPLVGIRDHQPHPSQPPPRTRRSRWPLRRTPGLPWTRPDVPQWLPPPLNGTTYGYSPSKGRLRNRSIAADPGDLAPAAALQPQGSDQVVSLPGAHPRSGTPPALRSPAPAPPAGGAPAGSGSSSGVRSYRPASTCSDTSSSISTSANSRTPLTQHVQGSVPLELSSTAPTVPS